MIDEGKKIESQDSWTQDEAIKLCTKIEMIAPSLGCHVALTGGCLYSEGKRKDVDIMVYKIRQQELDEAGLFNALKVLLGIKKTGDFGWCKKATYGEKKIDFLFPDYDYGDYKDEVSF